jgi:hypothetical protein|tara:strand:+ start:153 stop:503 length:351 start_codon:yes stop_codon:yes gene_type:complete
MTDTSKLSAEHLDVLASRARRIDPLFNPDPNRDFEPTVQQVIAMVEWEETPYDFPLTARDKSSVSFDPDRLSAVKTLATQWDMTVSATIDVLLRIALGEIAEFEANIAPVKQEAKS